MSESGFDPDWLRAQLGDESLVPELVARFLEALPRRVASLRSAVDRADRQALAGEAHRLGGSLGWLGARQAAERGLALERDLLSGKWPAADDFEDWLLRVSAVEADAREWLARRTRRVAPQGQ